VLAQIEQRERGRTGIGSLKVKFNSIFGYYIEYRSRTFTYPAGLRAQNNFGGRGALYHS